MVDPWYNYLQSTKTKVNEKQILLIAAVSIWWKPKHGWGPWTNDLESAVWEYLNGTCSRLVRYMLLLYGNWYGPAFLQSDWLIAGPYNTIRTTFFNFCRKSSISEVSVVLASVIFKLRWNFHSVLFWDTLILDKRLIKHQNHVPNNMYFFQESHFCLKMMMPYSKRFTDRVTRSVPEIRSPHFCARPSQARAVWKDRASHFLTSTDRVSKSLV